MTDPLRPPDPTSPMSTFAVDTFRRRAAITAALEDHGGAPKDPDTAFLIELVGGIFGLLGLGYVYVGLTNEGLIRLLGFWVLIMVLWGGFSLFATVTFGLGMCLAPVPLVIHVGAVIISALDLKKAMESAGMSPPPPAAS